MTASGDGWYLSHTKIRGDAAAESNKNYGKYEITPQDSKPMCPTATIS
jgi:hypothetical protein